MTNPPYTRIDNSSEGDERAIVPRLQPHRLPAFRTPAPADLLQAPCERLKVRKARQRHHEVAPCPAHQSLHRPLARAQRRRLDAQPLLGRFAQTAMRSSRLAAVKTLDQFDFAFQPENGGVKLDHGGGGAVAPRRSRTLPVWPFLATGRTGGFMPWCYLAWNTAPLTGVIGVQD